MNRIRDEVTANIAEYAVMVGCGFIQARRIAELNYWHILRRIGVLS